MRAVLDTGQFPFRLRILGNGMRLVRFGTTIAITEIPQSRSCQSGIQRCRLQGHVGVSGFERKQGKHGDGHQEEEGR